MDGSRVAAILADLGWHVRREPGIGAEVFTGSVDRFPVRVLLAVDRLEIQVDPHLEVPEDAARAGRLYERLLVLNAGLRMARFALEDDRRVVLTVDYPRANLDESEVRDALDAASYYADRHYDEIAGLAERPRPSRAVTRR